MSETRTTFSGGAYTTSWSTSSTEWANVQCELNSEENYDQNKKQQYTYYTVIMNSLSNVTNKNRLDYSGKTLVIEKVINQTNRNRRLVLKCREENT